MSNSTFEKLIKYFIFDLEYRKDVDGKWILCQLAYRCLNRRFAYIFEHSVYFIESLKCPEFVEDAIKREFCNESNYIVQLRKPEEYLHNFFNAMQLVKDGNMELVGHNASSFDIPSLENLMHGYGYPFYWNDHGYKNGLTEEGLFNHNVHDTRQIGEGYRALLNSYNIKSKVTLKDTAEFFGVPVREEKLHEANYDCWLTEQIFIKDKEEKALSTYFKNICDRAANPLDYITPVTVSSTATNNDYVEVVDHNFPKNTFVQPESFSEPHK
ncbi:MAG: hypothetical protein HOD18_04950 [Candidatus Marinimicrobia bacterium]|jgi:DNA polymerase III epsilon subunit-like protein|nr:hypothetical protein [Candidatus Neomarinimicrobiota bacterium]